MSAWAYQDVLELTCRQKWAETEESVSFELASKEESAFHFKPGQFATLGFELPEG
ncbi:hybrid-cluster NAD(P)-dependent oxidoreductase, partial [Vibrio anguillarum]|nr:hybrid-cluster NAD(P)-dependent oxidoreductase [Vibrio anguillarum]